MTGARPQQPDQERLARDRPVGLFCGLAVLDVIQRVAAPPGPDEKVTALDQVVAAGGPATNAAVTFAALGGRAVLAAPVGESPVAALVRVDLAAHGVELLDCAAPGATETLSVSSCTVSARTAERSVVSTNARVPATPAPLLHLAEKVTRGREPGPDVVLVDGHSPVLARAALDLADGSGALRLMDAGSWKDDAADLPPRCDVVAASARFRPPATVLASGGCTAPGHEEAAVWLLAQGVPVVVVTQGSGEVLWWRACGAGSGRAVPTATPGSSASTTVTAPSVTDAPPASGAGSPGPAGTSSTGESDRACRGSVRPPAVPAVDTLGAGDVFHGALALALAARAAPPAEDAPASALAGGPGPAAAGAPPVPTGRQVSCASPSHAAPGALVPPAPGHLTSLTSSGRSGFPAPQGRVRRLPGADAVSEAVRQACEVAAASTTSMGTRAWLSML